MNAPSSRPGRFARGPDRVAEVRQALASAQNTILAGLAILLALAGGLFLVLKIWRLAVSDRPDHLLVSSITVLYSVTRAWFEGAPVYTFRGGISLYPPATWLLLWPTYGWLTFDHARILWTFINLFALAALGLMCARAVAHHGRRARLCAGLAPLSMPAMADSFGIGQLTILVLPLAVGAVLVAIRERPTWRSDAAAAAMFVVALMKPSLTVPFFLPFLTAPGRLRPAFLATAGYAGLTYAASWTQPDGLLVQIRAWMAATRAVEGAGYGNVQLWLARLGWTDAFAPVALAVLVGLAAWVWRYRRHDVWLLLAVSAIVSRLWSYHRVYDDAVLIVVLIAVARAVGRARDDRTNWIALVLLAGFALVLWTPLQFHYAGSTLGPFTVTPGWTVAFNATHTAAAVAVLAFLVTKGTGAFEPSVEPSLPAQATPGQARA